MEVYTAIKARRSIRRFKSKPVSKKSLSKILDAARHAPSAGNVQPWEFIVVDDPKLKHRILTECISEENKAMETAPILVVACADTGRSGLKYGDVGRKFFAIVDVTSAVENMMIASVAEGLGTCWTTINDYKCLQELLELPSEIVPITVVPIGHPDEEPKEHGRANIEKIVHFNSYGDFDPKRIDKIKGSGKKRDGLFRLFSD
jgi:nitroreductase